MKISNVVILALKGMDRDNRLRLAQEMGITEDTFYRWIRLNDDNLTKAANLVVLRKEFRLADEQILEPAKVVSE